MQFCRLLVMNVGSKQNLLPKARDSSLTQHCLTVGRLRLPLKLRSPAQKVLGIKQLEVVI